MAFNENVQVHACIGSAVLARVQCVVVVKCLQTNAEKQIIFTHSITHTERGGDTGI